MVVERLIFGTHEEAAVDAAVDGFCRAQLAAPVRTVLFRAATVGVASSAPCAAARRSTAPQA